MIFTFLELSSQLEPLRNVVFRVSLETGSVRMGFTSQDHKTEAPFTLYPLESSSLVDIGVLMDQPLIFQTFDKFGVHIYQAQSLAEKKRWFNLINWMLSGWSSWVILPKYSKATNRLGDLQTIFQVTTNSLKALEIELLESKVLDHTIL